MTKYKAKKIIHDGITFDSKIEGDYYLYLKQQKEKGYIKDFELQPEFILQPKFEKDGKKYHPIKYKADFRIIHNNGLTEVVDIKGMETQVFKLKKKMYIYHFDEPLKLITYSKIDGGWIELEDLKKAREKRKKNKKKKQIKI